MTPYEKLQEAIELHGLRQRDYMRRGDDYSGRSYPLAWDEELNFAIAEYTTAEINNYVKPYLDGCREDNGRDSCKNCGLSARKQSNE
jgi:hypothetical protein